MELVSEHYRISQDPPKWHLIGEEMNRFRDALYEFGQLVLTASHQFQTRSTPQDGTWRVCPNCLGDGRFMDFDLTIAAQRYGVVCAVANCSPRHGSQIGLLATERRTDEIQ